MSAAISAERARLERATAALSSLGRALFSLAITALGIETLVCARYADHSLGPRYEVIPVLPWLPAIPWLAYVFGTIWVACGVGLLFKRTERTAAMALGGLLFLCALVLDVPKNAARIGSISLRTIVFETLALASLAWLLPGRGAIPSYLLSLSLIVFGVDHFLVLAFIATLLPGWIPWHVFWVAFFGVAFIAAGLSIGLNLLQRWGAACIGSMFGIWVVTLHLPRVLGLYRIPGVPRNPNEWSSLFIAVALWGGLWALARAQAL
jgi:uncharacterized membrane protein